MALRFKACLLKWLNALGVLCNRRKPTKLKGKFHKTAIRPILYRSECWQLKINNPKNYSRNEND